MIFFQRTSGVEAGIDCFTATCSAMTGHGQLTRFSFLGYTLLFDFFACPCIRSLLFSGLSLYIYRDNKTYILPEHLVYGSTFSFSSRN